MRLKVYFTAFLLLVFSFNIFAKKVDRATAEKVAIHFFYAQSNIFNHPINLHNVTIIDYHKVGQAYYVFDLENGWIIVSADDAMWPVIGYNFEGSFPAKQDMDYNVRSWMKTFSDEAAFVVSNNIQASASIAGEWAKYNKPDNEFVIPDGGSRGAVDPMLTCMWDQPNPYNLLCPDDANGPGGHVLVGCVATAMAQIMDYWRYPLQGSGQFSYYQSPYGVISADFGNTTYDWNGMQDAIDPGNPWAVALISFHAGVSVQMDYGPTASASQSTRVPNALKTYFTYNSSAQYVKKSNYNFSTWETMMQSDLNVSKPLYYSGYSSEGGHAFVCDGYQGSNYYHFNFGWSGYANGYYTLQDVNGFSGGQGMVRSIVPGDDNYPYVADGADTLIESSGSFTDGSGPAEDYPSGMNASWLISPQNDEDSISSIKLSFVQFNTASTDTLSIYGGNSTTDELLGKYAGNDVPEDVTFEGNQVFVTFSSTGSDKGFYIEYNTTSPFWCNGSQNFNEPSGTFSDGSGSFYYNNNSNCMFVITNPEAVNITLEFTDFATESGNDIVQVYNGDTELLIAELSGHELPDVISAETSSIIIYWETNSTIKDEGWTAEYTIDGVGINESHYSDFAVYPNPTSGVLNLRIDELPAGKTILQVANMNGQVVYTETLTQRSGNINKTIDLRNQARGVYMLSLISEKEKIDKKIILK